MEVCRRSSWLLPLLGVIFLAEALQGVQGEIEIEGPSESECRPYIEKALRELETVGTGGADVGQSNEESSSIDDIGIDEKRSDEQRSSETSENETETQEPQETESATSSETNQPEEEEAKTDASNEPDDKEIVEQNSNEKQDDSKQDSGEEAKSIEDAPEGAPEEDQSTSSTNNDIKEAVQDTSSFENAGEAQSVEQPQESLDEPSLEEASVEEAAEVKTEIDQEETPTEIKQESSEQASTPDQTDEQETVEDRTSIEDKTEQSSSNEDDKSIEANIENDSRKENNENDEKDTSEADSSEADKLKDTIIEVGQQENQSTEKNDNDELELPTKETKSREQRSLEESVEKEERSDSQEKNTTDEVDNDTKEDVADSIESTEKAEKKTVEISESDETEEAGKILQSAEIAEGEEQIVDDIIETAEQASLNSSESKSKQEESNEGEAEQIENSERKSEKNESEEVKVVESKESDESEKVIENEEVTVEKSEDSQLATSDEGESTEDAPEEDLIIEMDIPEDLRPRDHVEQLLKLDRDATKSEEIVDRISEITLRELKRLYENAIKPLETLYKYRDLSNRHYGDAEIFSKPLILFMGPWSGGKSSIINYLLNIEYNDTSLRTGAEPSPAYFNLLMYGDEEEVLDGTQLAADYTFSGLQKFGQGLEERLRGVKLRSKLLEKVNIVEIPGILEVRKQVSRVFPFNDACQWFIDRADIIFLVYDPSKLDVGPETEAILDQLKGREYQTRIVLNKADQVKPEELMRVQGALIWNISPLMSSPQPPIMYTTSLWSRPYEQWAPVRLLQAQERAFLRDLRSAVDRRIENKIASARRFAVRVRNHAKMVDCYLTTYYNHKSIFGNKKQVSDAIIEHPQDYHIYEGLSTLTNISRYDLPDPDVYKDFFRLNPLYEFQQLAATCTYFRGCPINKLDVAIAYDLPELVGKHKRLIETALAESNKAQTPGS